jgi:hypothetical protein
MYYAPREYLDDLPARVSNLLGCLAVILCLPKRASSPGSEPARAGKTIRLPIIIRHNGNIRTVDVDIVPDEVHKYLSSDA